MLSVFLATATYFILFRPGTTRPEYYEKAPQAFDLIRICVHRDSSVAVRHGKGFMAHSDISRHIPDISRHILGLLWLRHTGGRSVFVPSSLVISIAYSRNAIHCNNLTLVGGEMLRLYLRLLGLPLDNASHAIDHIIAGCLLQTNLDPEIYSPFS